MERGYRGKRIDTDEWIRGFYTQENLPKEVDEKEPLCDVIGVVEDGKIFNYFVRPESVGQWTGMFDKVEEVVDGGDIVKCEACNPKTYEVVYDDGSWYAKNGKAYIEFHLLSDSFTVIGNMTDNPELLKD